MSSKVCACNMRMLYLHKGILINTLGKPSVQKPQIVVYAVVLLCFFERRVESKRSSSKEQLTYLSFSHGIQHRWIS